MTEELINKQIRDAVFSEMGLKLSEDDPVFAVVLANKLMLTHSGGALQEIVRDIPRAINDSINSAVEKISIAVADSEKTVGSLRDETKGMLNALARVAVEDTHKHLKATVAESISATYAEQTKLLQSTTSAAELKIKELSTQIRESRIYLANIVLSAVLVLLVVFSGIGLVMMYNAAKDNADSSSYWYGKYDSQNKALDSLPANFKKQVMDQANKR